MRKSQGNIVVKAKFLISCAVSAMMAGWVGSAAAADASATAASDTVEEVVVLGRGETRQVQTIRAVEILEAVPGVSPLKVLNKLPSVNFQSADPFGNYEWSTRITIRGFNQNQLGFTLDDVPLGDMSYGNDNGLHISRAITSENIGKSELAQGAGALEVASTSNLGGSLKFSSLDPSTKYGVQVNGTVGSSNDVRGFARLETGTVAGGGRGYVSVVYQNADKYRDGEGQQKAFQINSKFIQPLGDVVLTGFINYSDRREDDYQDLSLQQINSIGWNLDNHMGSYALYETIAKNAYAGLALPKPFTTLDDSYYDASGLRQDTLGALKVEWSPAGPFSVKSVTYAHKDHGQGTWWTPYQASYASAADYAAGVNPISPVSRRHTEYDIERYGELASLTYKIASHSIEGGVWFEHNDFHQARRYYATSAAAPTDPLEFHTSGLFRTQFEGKFQTITTVFHLQDTWRVTDDLKVNFGFKSTKVDVKATAVVAALAQGTISNDEGFLPQVGAVWSVGNGEFFGDYSNNMRAFTGAITAGPFSTTQAGFDLIKGSLQPEKTDTFEGGYRFHSGGFEGSLAAYYVKFSNRLLSVQSGPAIVSKPSVLSNVGGVTSKGIEAVGTWRFAPNWSLFGSYSYNKSTYDSDVKNGSGVVTMATAGKTTFDTPEHLAKAEVSFDDGALFGSLGVSYMSSRFYSYTNDASVPAQTLADLSVGYRLKLAQLKSPVELRLNVTNLTDEKYISTVGSGGIPASDPTGGAQTLLPGAPRSAYVTVSTRF